jgi:hypothetical protein
MRGCSNPPPLKGKKIMKWIKDIASLIAAIIVWQSSSYLIRIYDPTAGADDPGILQAIAFTTVAFLFFHFTTKIYMRLFWPTLDKYLASGLFDAEFKTKATCAQRYYLAFLCYWLCMVVQAIVIL